MCGAEVTLGNFYLESIRSAQAWRERWCIIPAALHQTNQCSGLFNSPPIFLIP